MLNPQAQREFAIDVVSKLRARGYEALWAGGCVRDQLLGRPPTDYDVATNARPEDVREVFGKRQTIAIGAAFGVIAVLGPRKPAGQVEVATFRQDATYTDGRRPDSVTFSTAEADAQRRDFTINGLFYDPLENRVIDYVGGQADLERRVVRAIGTPSERFAEDKLRLLRAVRFTATFDFALDPATRDAIKEMAPEIVVVSAERIAAEMRLMLAHSRRTQAIMLLASTGLLAAVLPEISPDQANHWNITLANLEQLTDPGLALALAVLLEQFVDHAGAAAIGSRWKLSNKEIGQIEWLVKHKNTLCEASRSPWPRLQRLLIQDGIEDLLTLHDAIHSDCAEDLQFCRSKLALPASELNPPPLINGDNLQKQGIPPGPDYQRLLEAVRDAQLTGQVTNATDALTLAVKLWQQR